MIQAVSEKEIKKISSKMKLKLCRYFEQVENDMMASIFKDTKVIKRTDEELLAYYPDKDFLFTIGQMISFLDKNLLGICGFAWNLNLEIFHDSDWFVRIYVYRNAKGEDRGVYKQWNRDELVDGLWEAVKYVLRTQKLSSNSVSKQRKS